QEVASGEKSVPMIGLRINEFYAHDDQWGPFSRLIIKPSSQEYPVEFEGHWKDNQTGKILSLRPNSLLIPVYNKIRVKSTSVLKWLESLTTILSFMLQNEDEFEWDLFLTTINELKRSIKKETFPKKDLERILCQQQPRFIWRAIFRFRSKPILELYADATDMERSFPIYEQVWHNKSFHNAFRAVIQNEKIKDLMKEELGSKFFEFLINNIDAS
ncbi:MAG: hypothetical protein QUS35_06935, partial [bacterium]|nr:hypothetical protein [bacterium]